MARSSSPPRPGRQVVIDLSSDSDEADMQLPMRRPSIQAQGGTQRPTAPATPPVDNQAVFGAPAPFDFNDFVDLDGNWYDDAFALAFQGADPATDVPTPPEANRPGRIILIDGEVFIPDESPEPDQLAPQPYQAQINADRDAFAASERENFTAETCLQRTLAIFPDISHEHILTLYNNFAATVSGPDRLEQIIDKLVSSESYPKQEKGKQKKRKRQEDHDNERRWTGPNREVMPPIAKASISAMLKADFPEFTIKRIGEELQSRVHLYQTYVALAETKDNSEGKQRFTGRPSKHLADADTIAVNSGFPSLSEELEAARKKVEGIRLQRTNDEAKKQAEHENLQRAMAAGETAECQACFEDLPMNRQVHCDGDTPHFTCFECLTTYIKSEVGQSRCRVLCTSGCGESFAHAQLHRLEDTGLIEKLERLQQEKAIRDAGIEDLEECPFCEFKAILPPIDVDFEFRCENPECAKVSCRRCKAVSHTPVSCEEHAKDNKLNSRHRIEEAMTAALLRSCNKCKKQFIKDFGCNKMHCSSCGNLQCYVCSQSITNYDHFDQQPAGGQARANKCPLYDNVEERHEREVKEAEAAARRQILEENPDVTEEDLEIKLSDAVNKATQDKIKRANPNGGALFPPAAGAFHGGLFPMPRLRRPGFIPADDNEDGDDDEDEDDFGIAFMGPRMQQARQAYQRRLQQQQRRAQEVQMRVQQLQGNEQQLQGNVQDLQGNGEGLAIRERLGENPAPVEPRLQQQGNILQPPARVQEPAVQAQQGRFGFQGYIPVLGFRPRADAANPFGEGAGAQPQQALDPFNLHPGYLLDGVAAGQHMFELFGGGGGGGGGGGDPFGLQAFDNGAAFPAVQPVANLGFAIPPLAMQQQPAETLAQPAPQPANQQQQQHQQQQAREELIRRHTDRVDVLRQQRQLMMQRMAQQRQAQRDMQDRRNAQNRAQLRQDQLDIQQRRAHNRQNNQEY